LPISLKIKAEFISPPEIWLDPFVGRLPSIKRKSPSILTGFFKKKLNANIKSL
jgi:hypothetical protein